MASCDVQSTMNRFALFNLAGKIASHAGDLVLRIGAAAERLVQLIDARARLATLLPAAA